MAVAEIETQRVISDRFPTQNGHTRKLLRAISSIASSKDIPLALGLGAWRRLSQILGRMKSLRSVAPPDRDFGPDELNVEWGVHCAGFHSSLQPTSCPEY